MTLLNKDKKLEDMISIEDMSEEQLKAEIEFMKTHPEVTLMDALDAAKKELDKRLETEGKK